MDAHTSEYAAAVAGMQETYGGRSVIVGQDVSGKTAGKEWSGRVRSIDGLWLTIDICGGEMVVPLADVAEESRMRSVLVRLRGSKPVAEFAPGETIRYFVEENDGLTRIFTGIIRAVIDEEERRYLVTAHRVGGGQQVREVTSDQILEW